MAVVCAFWPHLTKDQWELVKNIAAVIGGLAALAGLIGALFKAWGRARPRWRQWRDRKTLKTRLGAECYTAQEILRATTAYIRPDCQSVDPAGGEDFRRVVSTREPLFGTVDRLLENASDYRYVILLADSGMGKSSFLLNYYASHWRSGRRGRFQLQLVPLNLPNSEDLIGSTLENGRAETVLCLDALDEDQQAIRDHHRRLRELIALSRDYRAVMITCRSQFFPKEEEIPTETGVLRAGPVKAGEPRALYFHKLYLSPFTDDQVNAYLRRRFPLIGKLHLRRRARQIIAKIPDLVARPMILAHVEDLVDTDRNFDYRFQIYEEMVNAWLEREKGLVETKDALRDFSERLAVDLFVNRRARGQERIAEAELKPLAEQYGIQLEAWQLRGRSLLNRDAVGNYKFAHRSIMEYLFIRRFASDLMEGTAQNRSQYREAWTDLMKTFFLEMIRCQAHLPAVLESEPSLSGAQLRRANLTGADLSRVNLSYAELREAKLIQTDLAEANLHGARLIGADLRDASLIRADLTEAYLQKAKLNGADLREAKLNKADLTEAYLQKAKLNGADLREAKLNEADLTEVDLSEADLNGAKLSGAHLRAAKMIETDVRKADLTEVDLQKAKLSGADLREAKLNQANLTEADLSEADLSGADLSNVRLSGADLKGAKLSGADLSRVNLVYAELHKAKLTHTNLTEAYLNRAKLNGADLREAKLNKADLTEADLTEADLQGAKLNGADLCDAKLIRADLRDTQLSGADFRHADLPGAKMMRADLREAKFDRADVSGADLTGADLSGVNLRWADLNGAKFDGANLCGADLRGSLGLTTEQLSVARTNEITKLGDHLGA